jgi:hypothetical protein
MHNVKTCLPSELFERIDEANTNPHEQTPESAAGYLPMMNGKTGALFMKIPADDPRRVLRSRLRSLFQIGIDVQFNMELTDHWSDGNFQRHGEARRLRSYRQRRRSESSFHDRCVPMSNRFYSEQPSARFPGQA